MTAKDALLELVAEMCEEDAAQLLGLANRFYDDEPLSDAEREELFRIQEEMKAGNFVTLEELDRRLGL